MRRPVNIYLVGPMGAGKSTIGRQLARDLQLEFYDTDQEIEARTGADVAWIFDVEGEDGFRKREKSIIHELTELQGIVLATGGGAILEPENRSRLAARGTVVYLTVSVDQQMKRTARDKKRPSLKPLLESDDPKANFEIQMRERDLMYREIADVMVATDARTVKAVSNEILAFIERDTL